MATAINYRELYFEYKELTRIEGEPTAEHLIKLNKELKSNALSVYSNLGGAQHGHLFLVMTPAQFELISVTPFVRPAHPGVLVIPPSTTQHMATTLRGQWRYKESIRLFKEVKGVKKALIQQIVQAVCPDYLNALPNRTTTAITGPVYNIINHLSTTYGHITAQMFDEREDEVRKMTYNPTHPIDNIFTAINNLVEFAELARNNITQRQFVTRALSKSGRFVEVTKAWNCQLWAQQNWIAFKSYFWQSHTELCETANLILEQANLEQRDALLVQQIMEGVQSASPQQSATTNTDKLRTEIRKRND